MVEPNMRTARLAQAMMVRRAVGAGDWDATAGTALARALEDRARDATGDGQDDRLDNRLCGFLGHILSRRGPDVYDYLSGMTSYGPQSLMDSRHGCGRLLFRLTVTVNPLRGGHRDIYVCERCGMAGNVSAGSPLPGVTIGPQGTVVVVPGEAFGPTGWYTAARQPVGGHREESIGVWPLRGDRIRLKVEIRPGDGLRRWAVALVSTADYAVVQVPVGSADEHRRRQP